MDAASIGKMMLILGIVLVIAGGLLMAFGKIPYIGKLPGDILIQKNNFTFYFPLATSIFLSAVLTLVFWLFSRR